jgi:hypothetical protein
MKPFQDPLFNEKWHERTRSQSSRKDKMIHNKITERQSRNQAQGVSREDPKLNTKLHNKASKAAKMRDRKYPFVASAALL